MSENSASLPVSDAPKSRRILVIDDEAKSVAGTVKALQDRHFSVEQAQTWDQAGLLLGQHRFDGIILDLMLPGSVTSDLKRDQPVAENGIDLLSRIRQGEFSKDGTQMDVFVWVLSALGQEADELARVKNFGVQEFFIKPTRPLVIAEAIRIHFEGD